MDLNHWHLQITAEKLWLLSIAAAEGAEPLYCPDSLQELEQILDRTRDSECAGLVFRSDSSFCAGFELREIASICTIEQARDFSWDASEVLQRLSELPITTVAAIHGKCFGIGLELALACTNRIAANHVSTEFALPQIRYGLIPWAGGSQRLPRVVGIHSALDMILTGRRISVRKAQRIGLIDIACPPDLVESQARMLATKQKINQNLPSVTAPKVLPKWATEGNPIGRKMMYKRAKDKIDERTKGFYPASYKALEAVFDGFDLSLGHARRLESALFADLVHTKQAQALVHLVHAKRYCRAASKLARLDERDSAPKKVGVIGAGLMGAGIATACVQNDMKVRLCDSSTSAMSRALLTARAHFTKQIDRRRMQSFELNRRLARISPSLDSTGVENCEIVIEAVFDDLSLKRSILEQVEQKATGNLIFASNTSAVPISELAATARCPDRVIGLHFFSPVESVPLVEMIVTKSTSREVISHCLRFVETLKKNVIVVNDGPGFFTTRVMAFFLAEALHLIAENCRIEDIDRALRDFGFPIGPIALIDDIGIDTIIHIFETIHRAFPKRMELVENLNLIAESGRLGRKNGRGFYRYVEGNREGPDHEIYELLGVGSGPMRSVPNDRIIDRCLLVMVNETARCLEEGVLNDPFSGDVGAVVGLSFPPFWGGPFKYIDFVGALNVIELLQRTGEGCNDRFKPASILVEIAKNDRKFFPEESWQASRH